MFPVLFSFPQEGLDGPTVARFAAQHGIRPDPAGPRRRPVTGPGPPRRSVSLPGLNLSRYLGCGLDRRRGGCEGDGLESDAGSSLRAKGNSPSQTADSDALLGPVAAALPDWWHADPAQRPPAHRRPSGTHGLGLLHSARLRTVMTS